MLNLLNSEQTRQADRFTIKLKGISSVDLMESAASAFVSAFKSSYLYPDVPISIYCGTGNNGGDGLAIARLLKEQGYDRLSVKIARFNPACSEDFQINLQRLNLSGIAITEISQASNIADEDADVIIDALLGSGLNRPLEGEYKKLVEYLNLLNKPVVAVDVPTGFPSEGLIDTSSTIIKADLVISFQRPRINFFMPESAPFINRFRYVDIGLDEEYIESLPGYWKLLEPDDIRKVIKPRKPFSHKGTYGHALIIAGAPETMGAAILSADACLHSGAGLTTACIPLEGLSALNSAAPEIMAYTRTEGVEDPAIEFDKFQSVAAGPGLGKGVSQTRFVNYILGNVTTNLVLDADALNILSAHPEWISILPAETILTPHLKEFDRLFGDQEGWVQRIEKGREIASQHNLIIVLKNQYTFIILPDGKVLINPTGNPAMASGGMGDVLTGMIAGFLAQGYKPEEASFVACYLHGKAGDLLKENKGMNCIPARYLIKMLPEVIGACS